MKKTICLILAFIAILIIACNSPKKQQVTGALIDTTGYYAARDLQGFFTFMIGDTYKKTYQEILNVVKTDRRFDYSPDLPLSHYFKVAKLDTLSTQTRYDPYTFGCPDYKEIQLDKYYIGDIEFTYLQFCFFKDTLLTIYCWDDGKISEGFNAKYGNAKVTIDSVKEKIHEQLQLVRIEKVKTWENSDIISTSRSLLNESEGRFKITTKDTNIYNQLDACENMASDVMLRRIISERQESEDTL
jgi:hypothetical protein